MKTRMYWAPEKLEYLIANYSTTLNADLAAAIGCTVGAVFRKAYLFGLRKDKEFIREVFRKNMLNPDNPARKTQFKKGNVPANKGKKQNEFMSQDAIERGKATRFKKGDLPKNTLYDGAITIRRGKGYIYKYIRVALGKWVLLHRYIWTQEHGDIPSGMNVQFKDGNSLNCAIDNLYLISRSDQLKNENSFHARYPEEVRQLIQLKGALKRQINKREKYECN